MASEAKTPADTVRAKAKSLPPVRQGTFLTDGGVETVLLFEEKRDLPEFAAFPLMFEEEGVQALKAYYRRYLELLLQPAGDSGQRVGFIFESCTWRASADWAAKLKISMELLAQATTTAITIMAELRDEAQAEVGAAKEPLLLRDMALSGCVGPRGDGYVVGEAMTADAALEYHSAQIQTMAKAGADVVTAVTMTYAAEAIGIVRAAAQAGVPAIISFTVETNGALPSGQSLEAAITEVDAAATKSGVGQPLYYMINCAHPTHFDKMLLAASSAPWVARIGGMRCNASIKSHAELDEATELDSGDVSDFGKRCAELGAKLPSLKVFGGCCGTNRLHVGAMLKALRAVCECK